MIADMPGCRSFELLLAAPDDPRMHRPAIKRAESIVLHDFASPT
jgi:hypothetical protein